MESVGIKSWIPIKEFNTIGIFEVFLRINKFYKILNKIENLIRHTNPNLIITIDSPSLNYRVVKRVQDLRANKNIKIFHYVAPTVWAWKEYRAKIFSNSATKCLLFLNLKINILLNINYQLSTLVIKFFLKIK